MHPYMYSLQSAEGVLSALQDTGRSAHNHYSKRWWYEQQPPARVARFLTCLDSARVRVSTGAPVLRENRTVTSRLWDALLVTKQAVCWLVPGLEHCR